MDEARKLGLGAVDYITKSFRPAIVMAQKRNHLEQKRIKVSLPQAISDMKVLLKKQEICIDLAKKILTPTAIIDYM